MFQKFKELNERFKKAAETPDYRDSSRMSTYGWGVIISGQLIRTVKSDGAYFFPEIARHHLSNVADAWTLAAMFDYTQMSVAAILNKPVASKPITCATAALVVGTLWEAYTAQLPNRKFDFADEGLYAGSSIAYVLAKKYRKKSASQPTPEL
jgi:hypothetical protein